MNRSQASSITVAVCGVDFGWGSAGKLAAILDELRTQGNTRILLLGTILGQLVLADTPIDVRFPHWPRDRVALRALMQEHEVDVGLVVLDPEAAICFEAAGVPTVYVDSLPYLWTSADVLPRNVAVYCAQQAEVLPAEANEALSGVANLKWIEAVTTNSAWERRPQPGLAILNVGGLHSPTHATGNPVYLSLLLSPAFEALAATGYRRVEVCGNIREEDIQGLLDDTSLDVVVGPRSHNEFLALMATADLLLTSPGLTTLIEASSLGCPTVCLPPQNLSQIFNGDRFAATVSERCRVPWPELVLDICRVNEIRQAGEEMALQFIDASLASVNYSDVSNVLTQEISLAILRAKNTVDWRGLARGAGTGGASELALLLRDLADRHSGSFRMEGQLET